MHSELQHDRAKRLFTYLKEFTQLKFKPQRTSQNDTLIWLHALPEAKEIHNAAVLPPQEGGEQWLSIRKPRFTLPPTLPNELDAWVTGLLDDPQRPPDIRDQLVVETKVVDDDLQTQTIKHTLFRDEEPAIQKAWEAFKAQWLTWAQEERRARDVQGHYSRLFDIHQKLTAESEKYELRLGLGYLSWQPGSGYEVQRHLLTARASLAFDPLQGQLTVTASGDGARTALEQDMLDAQDRVPHSVQDHLNAILTDSGEDLWSGETLPSLLRMWVNAANDRGTFELVLTPPRGVTKYPVVHWAPALILRKRGERTLAEAYDSILGQLQHLPALPDSAHRFIGGSVQAPPSAPPTGAKEIVYFPLPANDAQMDIIRRIRREEGVLVQGPPGTGKSHTIVNLVSHLLATDQKVLVTSHTARALKVLRDKFPAELASLCVTHLRGEEGARATLEGSVGEILRRATTRQPWQEESREQQLFSTLEQARQEEQLLLDKLQQIREAETGRLELFGYLGSALEIGEELRAQEPAFEWLSDLAHTSQPSPLTDSQASRLLHLLRDLSPEEAADLRKRRPDATTLPTPEAFVRFEHAERNAQVQATELAQARSGPTYLPLQAAQPEARAELLAALQALSAAVETEKRRPAAWVASAVDALMKGQFGRWKDLGARTAALLPEVLQRADWLEQHTPAGTEGRDPQTLRNDAEAVLEHLKDGGSWGNFLIRPAPVRQRMYLKETVRIGGRPADTAEVLKDLLDHLRLQAQWKEVQAMWSGQGVDVRGPLRLQATELAEHQHVLEQLNCLQGVLDEAQAVVRKVIGLAQPQWWDSSDLQSLMAAARAATAVADAEARKQALEEVLPTLEGLEASRTAHPVVRQLIDAIRQRQPDAYGQAYLTLQGLETRGALLFEQERLLTQLRNGAPLLAQELARTTGDDAWETRLATLEAAWRWVQADERLRELANPDAEIEVRERLAATRQLERDTLGQLAATKAWRSTLDRMTHTEQSALVRWQLAVKKIGKGTGKHAGRHRLVAQAALNDARTAIPAWIMPLHLVAESFAVTPGMFDVVIVDEASQAGPEALFLTFIAKKIIIVGDDKQIEPEGVGIQLDQVDALVNQYLYDFPAKEVIGDVKSSLFSFGSYTYPGRLPLREHFRCMPEIIKFSSDLSYPDEPLIALRQFGAERLQPLVARHVEGGYTMPNRSDKVNPPEARAIADQIKACIANPRYAGKTIGVISLVGDAQAELINSLLRGEVPETELEKRKLVCGNAYSFQGDERDVIFLSMVDSPSEGRRQALRSRDNPIFQPRYNVAVSRARDQLWLFHSVTLSDLAPGDLRASLIRHLQNPKLDGWQPLKSQEISTLRELAARPGRGRSTAPRPFDSWFELDVYLSLVNRGYRVIPQYELNGYRIDLVVEGLRGRLAVECDGDKWHGPERYRADLARQQTLERAGMEFWRVRGSTFTRDPEAALEDLWRTLDRRGVFPEGDPRNAAPTQAELQDTQELLSPATPDIPQEAATLAEDAAQDTLEQTASEPVAPVTHTTSSLLLPYTPWVEHPLPDPRTLSTMEPVIEGLREIVAAEGPMTCRQAYQTYCQAAGVRFGTTTKSLLNKAMTRALRQGVLLQADEWGTSGLVDKIVRTPEMPTVRLREPGPRKLTDVPPSEVHALMQRLIAAEPDLGEGNPEPLFRIVLSSYGAQRLTETARTALQRAYAYQPQELFAEGHATPA